MMLKRAESGKRVARRNGFYTGILTFIVVVCFAAMAIPYAVASVGATSIEGISQNESIVSGNMTTISISNSEQGSNCFSAEPPEELTLTQSPMEETIPSPTEEVIIPNSTANQTSTSEITVTPTPSTLNNSPALEIQSLECVDVPLEYPIYRSSENGPKLTTGNAEFVTDSSAILTGTLSNSDPDILYQIRFRYQISGNDGKFFSQPISVKGNSKFSIPITDLRPGTTYIFRAIGGISDPYINDAPNPSRSFKTAGTELPGTISSISASIDKDLIDYLDELLPDDGNCEYYNSAWEISPAQYKLMILAGIWSEGGKCGYSAHSNCVPDDACTHSAISNFVFSTGIGPAQVDRGQEHILDVGWDNWSTIEKLDWTKSLVSSLRVLKYHLDTCQKKGKLNCIEDMRACIKTTWFGYKIEEEGGLWASDWSAVTGTTWDTVKNGNKSCATLLGNSDITLEDIKGNVKGEWEDYHTVVRKIGKLRWKVMTDADINGYFDTYQILAGRLYGEQNTYYYMNTGSDVKGTEIWAYYNPEDSVHNLKSVFVRDYNAAKLYPLNAFPVTRSGSTISKGVIENMPEVGIFTCTPSNPKVGERIIFNYKVSAPEGVSSVELWRINDASKHDDCNIADDRWELIRSVQSITEIGTIEVISPVTGTHWYGLHVVDDTGAWACEKTPIRLTILEDSHIPEVISPDAGTQYDSDSVCVMINLKDIDIADKYEVVLSDGETRKSKEYSSLPVTITDSEIWGSDLPDGEYTVKYRYHFDENEQYGYSEGYSDFSTSVSFTVGEVEDKKIFFDSAQPYTSVSIKLKERTGTAALPASDSCVESLQNSESPGVYIYRGTTPLNISISDLSQSLPSDIVSSETDSEDYALGDRVEIKFSKYGYATEFVNITLGETENYTVDLASAMPESGLTDLIAKRIFTTTEIRRGEETSFYVEVINDGDVAAGPFNVGLWFFNGTLNFLGKNEVSLIPAKESLVVSGWSVVWPNDNGSYPVIAWVDCDDAVVNETDKINNLFPGIGRATKVNETTKLRPPTLLSPANGSTIDDDTPTFTWSPVEGADYYCLNYSGLDYPYLSTIKELNGASYAHHWLDRFIRDGTFQWNVTSYNITTGCSEVSPDSYFTLKIDRTKLRGPKAIEIGSDGLVYVLDEGNFQVQVFATNGTPIRKWGRYGSGAGEFGGDTMNGPWGMAVSPDGKVYVADTFNSRIQVFSSDGTYISQLDSTVTSLWKPTDVAIDSEGNIFVAISAGSFNYVVVFDSNHNFIRKWPTEHKCPLKTIFVDSHDIVYVNGYNKILKYTLEGELIGEIGPINYDPRGIYVDSDGTIYVACEEDFKILSPSGSITAGIGLNVDNYGWPRDIVVGPHSVIYCASGFIHWDSRNYITKHYSNNRLIGKFDGTPPPDTTNFAANVTTGPTPLTVQFIDVSTGNLTAWLWDFSDGATSTKQNPIHTYTAVGTYNVSLTVSNSGGSDTETKSRYVTVLDAMPVSLGDAAVAKGQVTQALLTIRNASAICAVCLDLTYDPAIVTVDSMSFASPWVGASSINNANGKTRIACTTCNGQSGDVPICTIALRATGKPGDISPLNITVDSLANADGKDLTSATLPIPGVFQVLYPNAPDPVRYCDAGDLYKGILSGNTLYFGEEGLNLTRLGSVQRLIHYSNFSAGTMDATIDVPDCCSFDLVTRGDLIPGRYYAWGGGGILSGRPWVEIRELCIGLDVLLGGTSTSVDGISLTRNAVLDFALENNLEGLHATPAAIFMDIEVTTPGGGKLTQFRGVDLRDIPLNASTIYARGISLNDTDLGFYTARAVWPSTSDFAGKGYDSNTVSFEIIRSTTPPVADFMANVTIGTIPLAVAFTDTSTGNVTSWAWDFGDGNTSTDRNPIHTYTAAGTYTVSLNASNAGGSSTETKTGYITVMVPPPVANFTANVNAGVAPLTIRFTDTTTENPSSWLWDFGDGNTSTDQNPIHTYRAPGTYTVSLNASNAGSSSTETKTDYITVIIPPPVAAFTTSVTEGNAPLTIRFTDTSTGEITAWLWSFGDGATATTRNSTHTYSEAGTYTVRLTITGPGGNDVAERIITVTPPATGAAFTANVTAGVAPLTVRFTDTSSNSPTTWLWTFGDSATSTEQHPVHTYTLPGNHTVTLSVDGGAEACTKPGYIKVTPILFGDATEDGEVNQADTLLVLQQVVGLREKHVAGTDEFQKTDVNQNGAIDVGDALFIAQYNVGLRDVWFGVL